MEKLYHPLLYKKGIAKRSILIMILLFLLIFCMFFFITLGAAKLSFTDVCGVVLKKLGLHHTEYSAFVEGVVLYLRMPRVILAVLAGLALGSGGAVMQSLLNNPLASPYTLGISSGSAFGAAIAIVLGTEIVGGRFAQQISWLTIGGAFAVGLVTMLLILLLASLKGGNASTLILAGVALSYLFSSGVSLLKYLSDNEKLQELTVWLLGGLYRVEWSTIWILVPIVSVCLVLLWKMSWDLNAMAAGEEVARSLGVNPGRLRIMGCIYVAFLTSSMIAFTGIIGFIGLIAPHICRMLVGNDNRFLMISSGLLGGLILLCADTIARLVVSPAELPVGIITSILGVPYFLYLLIKKRRGYWV